MTDVKFVPNVTPINADWLNDVNSVVNSLTINIKETRFGAVGNGIHDDTAAIQAAVNSAVSGATIRIPPGFYKVTDRIIIPNTVVLRIIGDGVYVSRIFCASASSIRAVFDTNDDLIYDTLEIKDIGILGNLKAGSGFHCEQLIHSIIDRVLVRDTTATAIRFNNGYNNTIQNCIVTGNVNGIDGSGTAVNNVNILNNQVYANTGIGILGANGLNINISGNGVEQNDVCGIMAYDIRGCNIENNYCERNGRVGYTFTSPETLTVKAEYIVLAGGKVIGLDTTKTVDSCRIVGNHLTPYGSEDVPTGGLSIDCVLFTTFANKMTIENNQVYDTSRIKALVGLYNNNTKARITGLQMSHNSVNTVTMLGAGESSFALDTCHNITVYDSKNAHNYAPQYPMAFYNASGTTGTLVRSATSLNGYPTMELSSGDHLYAFDILLSNYPELRGKYVWFGMYYRIQDVSGTGLLLKINTDSGTWSDSDGSRLEAQTASGDWVFKSVCRYISPTDTYITGLVGRIGSGGNPVVVGLPILAVFGDGVSKFNIPNALPILYGTAAPTTGNWKLGDRVINSNPTVGSPKAWVCTVGGQPGTWISEGNL